MFVFICLVPLSSTSRITMRKEGRRLVPMRLERFFFYMNRKVDGQLYHRFPVLLV